MKIGNKKVILPVVFLFIIAIYVGFNVFRYERNSKAISRTVMYLKDSNHREENLSAAISLNGGKSENTCVYFASGALRNGGLMVPDATANTTELMDFLKSKGFKKHYDLEKLKEGDICFTSESGDKNEVPDHTYIFMRWVDSIHKDAYVCDNQKKDYGDTYHKRNITYEAKINNEKKSRAIYYMR
ncbi:hypothetical protein NL50_08320 [Clostridium acetobutylicum]|nr:hypothetical protein NL50_08320 [Clostridium acetobutylicum]